LKISIVTISFNQSQFLERTIRSVIEQGYDNLEYIVVDPGSTDGSRDIIEKYRGHISSVVFEPDNGPVDGLNKGFSRATGDICGYLNSDDAFLPGTLKKVGSVFQARPDIDVVCGHGYIVDASNRILRRFYSDQLTPWRYVNGGAVVMQQSTFFKRDAFLDVGGFNPENPIWWDGELMLDFAMAGKKIRVENDFWSIFTLHHNSISGQRGKASEWAAKLEIDRKSTHARLYQKVMGRPYDRGLGVSMILARIQKWLLQPIGTAWRVVEKLGIKIGRRDVRI
jgi:glycosyltransferase involved in cell wall biosynthesis